ncbi:MAG: hypothetical protein AMXMBFR7_12690 [Planctomycetota bacterium]
MAEVPSTSSTDSIGLSGRGVEIARQTQLPLSKAIEISLNSVKIRFWRSLITAGGVVLAIMFLMATLTRGEVIDGLKRDLPPALAALQKASAPARKDLLAKLEAMKAAGLKVDAPLRELRAGDADRSMQLWNDALDKDEQIRTHAEAQNVLAELQVLTQSGQRYKGMEKLRLELIKSGENVLSAEQYTEMTAAQGQGMAAAAVADKEHEEAQARNRWLIGLALLVALVGITNSMLMSVTERFREIGTMKCLGALNGFIVRLFLIESSMQGFIGTTLGVILGLAMSFGKLYWEYGSGAVEFLPWSGLLGWIGVALGIGTAIAVVGAVYPAVVAAKMEPVVAMRVDQ